MTEARTLTTESGLSSPDISEPAYMGEGRNRQDQPGISGVTRGQNTQHKHFAV